MSPLANLLSRGKEEHDSSTDVSDLPAPMPVIIPRINLLPPEIAEAERFRREQVIRGAVVAGALALVVAGFVAASGQVSDAQSSVDTAKQRSAALQSEVDSYAEVPRTAAELTTVQAQRTAALGEEVRWSFYLNNLGLEVGKLDTQIQTMTVTQAVGGAEGANAPTSFSGQTGIATVTYGGIAKDTDEVSYFLEALAKQPGNVDPSFTSASDSVDAPSDKDVVSFGATVTVTNEALSNRYSKTGG